MPKYVRKRKGLQQKRRAKELQRLAGNKAKRRTRKTPLGGRQATFSGFQKEQLDAFLVAADKAKRKVEFTADFEKLRQYRSAAAYSGTADFTGKRGGIDPWYLLHATETRGTRMKTVRVPAWEGVQLFVRGRADVRAASGMTSVTVTVL